MSFLRCKEARSGLSSPHLFHSLPPCSHLVDLGGSETKPMATDAVLESLETEDRLPSISSTSDRLSLFGFPWVVLGRKHVVCLARGGAFGDLSPSLYQPSMAGTRSLAQQMVATSWRRCLVPVSGINFGHSGGDHRGGKMAVRVGGLEDMFLGPALRALLSFELGLGLVIY
ncbi:unnamed protein product [Linum trigynum]|uniref:Uncharacterized protein n=1 Tax=Linum trigynum TaxID=586398 RepID=A0AAV2DUN2_9ROSI